jgi:hypothetical protein
MDAHRVSALLKRNTRTVALLLTVSIMAHAETMRPPFNAPLVIQSAQERAVPGSDDPIKVRIYCDFIFGLGVEDDAKVAGKTWPFVDWHKENHLAIRVTDEQWDTAYQIFLDAYERMTGRVPLAADASSALARARGHTTLPTGLEIYRYTIQELRANLDEEACKKLDVFIEQYEHGFVYRDQKTPGPSSPQGAAR